ncbi:MAG: thermonuclease family protein [Thermomicrobiales bacterium]
MAVKRKNCDYCGRPIELRQLGPKTWKPFDPDGTPHDCPGRFAEGRPVNTQPAHLSMPPSEAAAQPEAPATLPPVPAPGNPAASSNLLRIGLVALLGIVAAFLILPRFFGSHEDDAANSPRIAEAPAVATKISPPTIPGGNQPATVAPKPRPTATMPPDAVPASDAPFACDAFDNQIWAQAVFDQNPRVHADLDPDGDGFACEELPYGAVPALWTTRIPAKTEQVKLLSTIDGDTIVIRRQDGRTEHVRLVGIDTPETGKGTRPLECYGAEATDFTRQLLAGAEGSTVWLEQDVEDRDRYGRLLRYVWFKEGGRVYMANDTIVRSGYAERYRDTPNRRYYQNFIDGQTFAKTHQYGLWSACHAG